METDGCPSGGLGASRSVFRWGCLRGGRDGEPADLHSFPVATDARVGGDKSQTRFVMDLDRKIDLHVFTLANPYRVVLDIPQVRFQMPPNTGDGGRGLIKTFRYGLVMAGGSRVVIDVTKPVRVDKAFVVDAADGAPARLVLDLAATDRDSFLKKIAQDEKLVRVETPPANAPQPNSADPRPLVVLDPGHGGIDTGTKAPSGERKRISCSMSPDACAIASRRPANTACC